MNMWVLRSRPQLGYFSALQTTTLVGESYVHSEVTFACLVRAFSTNKGGARKRLRSVEHDVSFGTLKKICAEEQLGEALQALDDIDQQGTPSYTDILGCLLKGCINKRDLVTGRELYWLITKIGFESNTFLGSYLIRLFALSEGLSEANLVFNKILEPNVFNWSAIISAHVKHGESKQAIKLHCCMQQSNVHPDEHVFVAVLNACANVGALTQGKLIHVQIVECGVMSNVFVGNALIDMYSKCGSLDGALGVFNGLPKQDMVSWNAMIAGYAQHGLSQDALQLFQLMQQEGRKPGNITFVSVVKACSSTAFLNQGNLIYAEIIKNGCELDEIVGSALINMYAKCGKLTDAHKVFDRMPNQNVAMWNAMVTGYAYHGNGKMTLELFQHMKHDGVKPNEITCVSILKACSNMSALDEGKCIHSQIIVSSVEQNAFIGSTLIDMYTTCGSLVDAHTVFDKLSKRDLVAWSALITGYAQHGYGQEALQLFLKMQREGMRSDIVTYVTILKACSNVAALDQGKLIHFYMIESGLESDVCLGSTLIDMYAKCGSLKDALRIFDNLQNRNLVTWSAIIAGYALHGDYRFALQYFKDMQQQGLKPDDVIFVCLLSACGQMGLVVEGKQHFKAMRANFGLTPTHEHYNCMVDLLGRTGCLTEAEDFVKTLPVQSRFVGWMTLLNHCRTHGNILLGRRCFDHIMALDCGHASAYVLMCNIYADAEMWEDAETIQGLKKDAQAWKKPGRAIIEVDNNVHEFVVGDKSHPQKYDIYAKLNELSLKMMNGGHVPHLASMLHSVLDEKEDEDALCGHSWRLWVMGF